MGNVQYFSSEGILPLDKVLLGAISIRKPLWLVLSPSGAGSISLRLKNNFFTFTFLLSLFAYPTPSSTSVERAAV